MKIIGLTGGFGTGKSFVTSILKKYFGAKVFDADKIAHDLIKKGRPSYQKIIAPFGKDILNSRRIIDRKKLARIVFDDKALLKRLNGIIHPEVIKFIKTKIARAKEDDLIVIDAPLLVEARLHRIADKLIVVRSSRKNQLARCVKKYRMKKKDILRRIECQVPLKDKIRLSDFVIDNNGTKADTVKQVRKVWCKIWR